MACAQLARICRTHEAVIPGRTNQPERRGMAATTSRRRGPASVCAYGEQDIGEEVLSGQRDDIDCVPTEGAGVARAMGRRDALAGASALSAAALGVIQLVPSAAVAAAAAAAAAYGGDVADEQTMSATDSTSSSSSTALDEEEQLAAIPDYSLRGPYGVRRLPKLEHTCVSCFPRCVGDACLLSIDAYVPSAPPPLPDTMFPLLGGAAAAGSSPSHELSRGPYPLAVLTSGFLVDAEQYASYARRLCSWGYVVLQYNKRESVGVAGGNALDDVVSAAMVDDLIRWAQSDVLLSQLIAVTVTACADVGRGGGWGKCSTGDSGNGGDEGDRSSSSPSSGGSTSRGGGYHYDDVSFSGGGGGGGGGGVYLVGHSRGAKISMLQAMSDPRVRAACLLDPVDNTVYAPLGEGFPSAVAAMRKFSPPGVGPPPPLVVVGGSYGGDCAPKGSNYLEFLKEASRDSWGVEVQAGHFQFLDNASFVQRAVCEEGTAADAQVRELSQALMVAHAETVFRGVPRQPALRKTLATLESSWGGGAFDALGGSGLSGAGGETRRGGVNGQLPWVVLQDGA